MDAVLELWLPIVVSTVVVFILSFLAWAVIGHHKADMKRAPDQDALLAKVRELGLGDGVWVFPQPEAGADCKSAEVKKLFDEGPWGMLQLWPKPNMGLNMLKSVVIVGVLTVFVAYLSSLALAGEPDPGFMRVFRVAGAAAVLGHCFGGMVNDVWFAKPARFVVLDFIDKLVFGLATGAVFALMWPGGAPAA